MFQVEHSLWRRSPGRHVTDHSSDTMSSKYQELNNRFSTKKEAVRMERSQEERTKYPDRINLDRRGLHGIPVLTEEPGLRLLSLQHNFIKKIHNLEFISRLVFLDLYHNRLDHIAGLEPLTNLRVLMLGKNRIRKIECLANCPKLSVLDLHGNRIGAIVGLEKLTELKVLNLASNLIRKVTGLQNLALLEELNLRRNRIRSTHGLETVPSLQKLYMSNNEIQGLSSLVNMDYLTNLQTLQMEGNPVWTSGDYSYHLVSSLPALVTLDQQDVSQDIKAGAKRWKDSKNSSSSVSRSSSRQHSPNNDKTSEKSKALLYKKLEERNASISNAKHRWNFLKTKTLGDEEDSGGHFGDDEDRGHHPSIRCTAEPKSSLQQQEKLEESSKNDDDSEEVKSDVSKGAIPKIIKRQTSDKTLLKPSVNVTPPTPALVPPPAPAPAPPQLRKSGVIQQLSQERKVSTGAGNVIIPSERKISTGANNVSLPQERKISTGSVNMPPPLPIRDSAIRIKFPGLERRRFALPQRYETLNDSDEAQKTFTRSNSLQDLNDKQKIGFFTVNVPRKVGHQGESSSTCQSDDDDLSGDFLTDSQSTSDSDTDTDDHRDNVGAGTGHSSSGFTSHTGRRMLDKHHARGRSLAKNVATSRSSSQLSEERGPITRNWNTGIKSVSSNNNISVNSSVVKISNSNPSIAPSFRKKNQESGELSGRTSEQGKDYLIELDGDLLR